MKTKERKNVDRGLALKLCPATRRLCSQMNSVPISIQLKSEYCRQCRKGPNELNYARDCYD